MVALQTDEKDPELLQLCRCRPEASPQTFRKNPPKSETYSEIGNKWVSENPLSVESTLLFAHSLQQLAATPNLMQQQFESVAVGPPYPKFCALLDRWHGNFKDHRPEASFCSISCKSL